jgi:hypothetical protein
MPIPPKQHPHKEKTHAEKPSKPHNPLLSKQVLDGFGGMLNHEGCLKGIPPSAYLRRIKFNSGNT